MATLLAPVYGRVSPRVLLVEDNPLIALDMQHSLTVEGFAVLGPAPTVNESLSILEETKPDLAVLDVKLDDGLSTEVAEALLDRGIPFVVVTGYSDLLRSPALDSMAFAGAQSFSKPTSVAPLVASLNGLLREKTLRLIRAL